MIRLLQNALPHPDHLPVGEDVAVRLSPNDRKVGDEGELGGLGNRSRKRNPMITARRKIAFKPRLEITAWKYMRLSAILLVPLVWLHTIINTLVIGAENISLSLVATRWTNIGWQVYDILLLTFAFSHGMNGLRQVLMDFTASNATRKFLNILLLFAWLFLSIIGASAILGGIEK